MLNFSNPTNNNYLNSAKIVKYVQIFLLGICFGFPVNLIYVIQSLVWNALNKSKLNKPNNKEYASLERTSISLDNQIEIDYFQTKKVADKVAGK